MTDNQIDAMIDRQIEQHEIWLEQLDDEHWQQELEEIQAADNQITDSESQQ